MSDAARECYETLDGSGFDATERLLKTILKSPLLTTEQARDVKLGIALLRNFPERWPNGRFYLDAMAQDESQLVIWLSDESLRIEIQTGMSWVFEFDFSRKACSGDAFPTFLSYVSYIDNEINEHTYSEFTVLASSANTGG